MSIIALNGALLRKKYKYPETALYTESEANTMITTQDYIPVASASELNTLRNNTTQKMGAGTRWEDDYTTGLDKKYIVVAEIDVAGSASHKWTRYRGWVGIFY